MITITATPSIHRRPPLLKQGEKNIRKDQNDNDDRPIGDGIVPSKHGLLAGFADDEQEDEVEDRNIRQCSLAG